MTKGPATGNTFDWDAARSRYLEALTLRLPTDREAALASTFQALGNALHLVQDLAVPAHVRSDFMSHLQYCAPEGSDVARWCSNTFERYVRLHSESIDSAKVEPAAFASQPVTRFWDLDRYVGNNPSADALQGLAEYTNANFPSQNTIFTESLPPTDSYRFPYPQEASTDLAELLAQRKLFRSVPAEDGVLDANLYLEKTQHGERLTAFLKPGYLTDYVQSILSLRPYLRLTFLMDETVMGEYATKLLPRAVNYSAGLLDYFFRGRLKVQSTQHPVTGEAVLSIVNRSPDPLRAPGTFTLYRDDEYGNRTAVLTSALTLDADVPKDNDPPLYLPIPANVSMKDLTLVYQGPLGAEPDAVIGKAFLPPRVERIFLNWTTNNWMLQTPEAQYVLPLKAVAGLGGRPAGVYWAEQDNQIAAYTWRSDGFKALLFEIDRPVGSAEVPTTAPGSGVVALRLVQQIPLDETLAAIDLHTTVDYVEHLEFTQYRISYTSMTVCQLQVPPIYNYDTYNCTTSYSGETVAPLRTLRDAVSAHFPLVLTPPGSGATSQPYSWVLHQVWADTNGHLLATVRINIGPLPMEQSWRQFPVLMNWFGTPTESGRYASLQANLEEPALLVVAVVDLTAGRLLGKTSQDVIRLEKTQRAIHPSPGFWGCYLAAQGETLYVGGVKDGQREGPWGATNPPSSCASFSSAGRTTALLTAAEGTQLDGLEGIWGSAIPGVEATAIPDLPPVPLFFQYGYERPPSSNPVNVRVERPIPAYLGPAVPSSWYNRLWWFGPSPGRLAFQADASKWPTSAPDVTEKRVWLVDWSLQGEGATAAYQEAASGVAATASGNRHGVLMARGADRTWLWVPWTGAMLVFPDRNPAEASDFVPLDGQRLLNIRTGQFYLLAPGLPLDPDAPSFPPGGSTYDRYHLIGD